MPILFPVSLKLIHLIFLRKKAVNDNHPFLALHQDRPVLNRFSNTTRGAYAVGIDNAGLFC